MALSDLLNDVLSKDEIFKMLQGAPTSMVAGEYGVDQYPTMLNRLLKTPEGQIMANKALEGAGRRNPAVASYIKGMKDRGGPLQTEAEAPPKTGILDILKRMAPQSVVDWGVLAGTGPVGYGTYKLMGGYGDLLKMAGEATSNKPNPTMPTNIGARAGGGLVRQGDYMVDVVTGDVYDLSGKKIPTPQQ